MSDRFGGAQKTHVVLALVLLVLAGLFLAKSEFGGNPAPAESGSPPLASGDARRARVVGELASAARPRAEALPKRRSGDAKSILELPPSANSPAIPDEQKDYGPNQPTEWVVDVKFDGKRLVTTNQVDSAFIGDWRERFGAVTFYGYSPEEKRWTYLHAKDVPTKWTALAVAVNLVKTGAEPEAASEATLANFLELVRAKARKLEPSAVSAREPAAPAARRAEKFVATKQRAAKDATIVLSAPAEKRFEGKDVWDVMLSLGLQWGDMDIFHWQNPSDVGDTFFFSVWTRTEPGYFLPQRIAAGQVQVDDLVFGFSIPRNAAPEHTLRQMHEAARYAQRRLGGAIRNGKGTPFNLDTELGEVKAILTLLDQASLQPGTETTLRLF